MTGNLTNRSAAGSIGINFSDGSYASTSIESNETAMSIDGANWTNIAITGSGGLLAGSKAVGGLSIAWNGSNAWSAGSEALSGSDASQQAFRVYLDDGDGGSSYFNGDNYGASVQISGLNSFLLANQTSLYALTLYFNTDSTTFGAAQVRQGVPSGTPSATSISSLPSLGTISAQTPLGDGYYPFASSAGVGTSNTGHRGVGTLSGLSADSITIAMPKNAGGGVRGSLAGFSIAPVPEPSVSMMVGSLALLGLLGRRR